MGVGQAIQKWADQIDAVVGTDYSVVIQGETVLSERGRDLIEHQEQVGTKQCKPGENGNQEGGRD